MSSPGCVSMSHRASRHERDAVNPQANRGRPIAGQPASTDDGCLRIRAERIGSRTAIVESFRSVPFHLGIPSDRVGSGRAEIILQNVGPGMLAGDHLRIDVEAGSSTALEVRGQGANRIHPSPSGIPGRIETRLRVAPGGLLVFLPGELIPYRTARLQQTTMIEVAEGGHLALAETLTRGREAMGERDLYTFLDLGVRARYDDRLVLIERSRLEPAVRTLAAAGRHGPFAVSTSLYLIGERWRLPAESHGAGSVIWAIAAGDGFLLARILGGTTQAVNEVVRRLLDGAASGLDQGEHSMR